MYIFNDAMHLDVQTQCSEAGAAHGNDSVTDRCDLLPEFDNCMHERSDEDVNTDAEVCCSVVPQV